ncbi:MAG: SDR family NAD(P)-dependent oxidoreductase, partial [Chloroflexi bacterium]|nr:SDR family NAD(P)-dependent oxidoreductase [Chloroflexota bacterium]
GLDILHNNAGIITGMPRFPDGEPEHWLSILEVNLRGVILGTHYGIQAMRKRGGGVIVNTASVAGLTGYAPNPVYSASKGGVVLFTASLALLKDELNIRVNCVCPGVVNTPMLTRARGAVSEQERQAIEERMRAIPLIAPEEIADIVVEFIRDDSLAGRAMRIVNGRPRELVETPQPAVARFGG